MLDEKKFADYVTAALSLQDLHLNPSQQEAVTAQFCLLAEMAQRFMNQPQAADEEPAPVYRL